jgi:hypothetical protein
MMKKKVNENGTEAAKTLKIIDYAKSVDCELQICPWQHELQCSIQNFKSCNSRNSKLIWLTLYLIQVLAMLI